MATRPMSPVPLSPRERQALELIARGLSYAEVARVQQVRVSTARTQIRNVYAKLGAHSKSEAVFEAAVQGLLPPNFWALPYHAAPEGTHGHAANDPGAGPRTADLLGRA